MNNYEQLQDNVAYGWRNMHGRTGVYIHRPISSIGCIIYLLKLFLQKDITQSVGIICDNSQQAIDIRKAVNFTFEHHFIDVQYKGYIKDVNFLNYKLLITVNINDKDIITKVVKSNNFAYYLCIFDKRDLKDTNTKFRESLMPFIQVSVPTDKIVEDIIQSPVKEYAISIDLTDKEAKEYKDADKYIKDSMKIFQSLEVLNNARIGNKNMGYSAITVCDAIARNNGWNEHIDVNTEFGKELDKFYNPNAIHQRANLTYSIMQKRRSIVANTEEKFKEIAKIVLENKDKKILIVSSKGDYASKITDYLNHCLYYDDESDYIELCANYHNELENIIQKDINGNDVLVKSGLYKGEPKIIGWQKQSTLNEKRYNDEYINVLSIKAFSSNALTIECDIVIFTSPLVGSIYDIRRRFNNILFRSNPLILYTIYCNNTIENNTIDSHRMWSNYELIYQNEDIFISD